MTTTKWNFSVEDKPHEVMLKRGSIIPNPEIWLDGQMVEKWREFLDKESIHNFDIDRHPAVLGIAIRMSALEYFLLMDGELVEADGKGKKLFGKSSSQFLETRQKWIDLGKAKGLEYRPTSNTKQLAYTHRVIGRIDDFLVIIQAGKKQFRDVELSGFFFSLKYASIDPERIEKIKNDQIISEICKDWQMGLDQISPTGLVLFMKPVPNEDTEEDVFEAFSDFIKAISIHVRPAMEERCEGPGCGSSFGQDLQIVLMNGMPMILCQDYAKHIADMGKNAELNYHETPNNLLKGTLLGIIGMVAGILPLLIFPIFLNRVYPVIALFPFAGIMWAMRLTKTKQNFVSILIASFLSLVGSIIGTSLSLMIFWIKQNNWAFDNDLLLKLIQRIIENPKLIKETINISLLFIAIYAVPIWIGTRQERKLLFHPETEVIPSFKPH